jgi:hypothetical protein
MTEGSKALLSQYYNRYMKLCPALVSIKFRGRIILR